MAGPAFSSAGTLNQATNTKTLTVSVGSPSVGDVVLGFVFFNNTDTSGGSGACSATCYGNSATQIGSSVWLGNISSYGLYIAAFKYVKQSGDTGSGNYVFTTTGGSGSLNNVAMKGGSESFSNVDPSQITAIQSHYAAGATGSHTPTTAAGHLVAQMFLNFAAATAPTAYNQTSEANTATTWGAVMGYGTATGSTLAFTCSPSGSYGSIAIDLQAVAGYTVSLGGDTLATIAGTTNGIITTPGQVTLSGDAITAIAGTINAETPYINSLTAAAIAITGGLLNVLQYPTFPGYGLLKKLNANQSGCILNFGDSISRGVGDGVSSPFLAGWTGRILVDLATMFNMNGNMHAWGDDGNAPTGFLGGYGATTQAYDAPYSLYTGTQGGGGPSIEFYNAASSGKELTYLSDPTRFGLMTTGLSPDLIIVSTLVNDWIADSDTPTQYTTALISFIQQIQNTFPNVPIIVTNENQTNNTTYEPHFAAMAAQQITDVGGMRGVTLYNTRSAFTNVATMVQPIGTLNGVHPLPAGYVAQEQYMLLELLNIVELVAAAIASTAGVVNTQIGNPNSLSGDTIATTNGIVDVIAPVVSTLTGDIISTSSGQVYAKTPVIASLSGDEINISLGDVNTVTVDPSRDIIVSLGADGITTHSGTLNEVIGYNLLSDVWFMGVRNSRVGKRIISADDWEFRLGPGDYQDNVWSTDNDWSLPISLFSTPQLGVLEDDFEFLFGQFGARG